MKITEADIAKTCHQANKALCEAVGDTTQKDWDAADEWQRESAIKGVRFALENPDAPESAQHDAWVKDKVGHGWKYGLTKNPETKEHPCIVPFTALPLHQQAKDVLFRSIVAAMKPLL
jgi:hypothetical protein